VRLRARDYETGTAVTPPVYIRQYGILEPLNKDPTFQTQLFDLYRKARIHGSSIKIELINTGSEPIELVLTTLPYNWTAATPTLAEMVEKSGAKRVIVSGAGGMDRATVSKTVSARQILGHDYASVRYDFDITQANSTTPILSDEPVWMVGVSSLNSMTSVSYRLEVIVEYDYEFYDQDSVKV
jgi:hypothetical protein